MSAPIPWSPPLAPLPSAPGVYLLWLRADDSPRLRIGALGVYTIEPGYYAYVGSALGPGGLSARAGRHLRVGKSARWHIDYLREVTQPIALWFSEHSNSLESLWAHHVAALPGVERAIPGFGASDSRAVTHLAFSREAPDDSTFQRFRRALGEPHPPLLRLIIDP